MVNLGSYFNYAVPMGKHQLTAVSLFAGVGGFDLALERAGVKVVAAVEIDKNARGVLAKQFPNTQLFNDVTTVTGKDLRDAGFIPEHGIITGGFPCQDLSVAGKRAGLAGQRSGLYWQIVRLVEELSPKYLILENVPGLLSSNGGKDMGTVIGALTDRGYGVGWRVLDAQYFGVAQRRRRVFIVGCLGDDGAAPGEILALCEGLSGDTPSGKSKGQDPATDAGTSAPIGFSHTQGLDAQPSTDNFPTLRVGGAGHAVAKPMLLTQREGKPGGGKGPLISEDISLTLATGNGQVLINPNDVKVGPLTALGMANAKGTETSDSHHIVIETPERERADSGELSASRVVPSRNSSESGCEQRSLGRVYGQTGYAKYTEDQVTTLAATTYKRPEDNVVVREVAPSAE